MKYKKYKIIKYKKFKIYLNFYNSFQSKVILSILPKAPNLKEFNRFDYIKSESRYKRTIMNLRVTAGKTTCNV